MTQRKRKPRGKTKRSRSPAGERPRCGLCGKTGKLTKTDCCNQWICDDEDKYVLFSYARNSCHRNHRHYTLCAYHHNEGHPGHWKTCKECRKDLETEMYVWYGTNEYNFEKLENPPVYEPTHCSKCGTVIRLGEEGYTSKGDEYWCEKCAAAEFPFMQAVLGYGRGDRNRARSTGAGDSVAPVEGPTMENRR